MTSSHHIQQYFRNNNIEYLLFFSIILLPGISRAWSRAAASTQVFEYYSSSTRVVNYSSGPTKSRQEPSGAVRSRPEPSGAARNRQEPGKLQRGTDMCTVDTDRIWIVISLLNGYGYGYYATDVLRSYGYALRLNFISFHLLQLYRVWSKSLIEFL